VPLYRDYRLTLRLLAPLGTPMHSDTLFGHLVWQVRFAEGQAGVKAFLAPFLAGEPPFILSDAFPQGLLPRPLLPRPHVEAASPAAYASLKRWQKAPFVRVTDFLTLVQGRPPAGDPVDDPWQSVQMPHAAIDRSIGTSSGQGRFFQTEAHILPGDGLLEVYLRAADDWVAKVETLVRQVARIGFGRDKSVGNGAFELVALEPWEGFASFRGADAFVSLSTMIPAATDPTEGFWRLRVKRGYLGENAGGGNPFKRPLLQFEPGAVFRTGPDTPRPFYGRIVPNVAPGMSEAVQCGLALAVPCRWRTP